MQSEQKTHYPRNRWFWFVMPVVIGLTLDLGAKSFVFRLLEFPRGMQDGRILWGVNDFFGLQLSLNPGALFGLGGGKAPLFAMLSLVAAVGIVWWLFVYGAAKSRFLTCLLGVITAGILGNLYDRLGLHGICWSDGSPAYVVRDWILVMLGSYHWPNFNLADCYLVCGAILLCITNLVAPEILAPHHAQPDSDETSQESSQNVTTTEETEVFEKTNGTEGTKIEETEGVEKIEETKEIEDSKNSIPNRSEEESVSQTSASMVDDSTTQERR